METVNYPPVKKVYLALKCIAYPDDGVCCGNTKRRGRFTRRQTEQSQSNDTAIKPLLHGRLSLRLVLFHSNSFCLGSRAGNERLQVDEVSVLVCFFL